jgi:hypothetical protein
MAPKRNLNDGTAWGLFPLFFTAAPGNSGRLPLVIVASDSLRAEAPFGRQAQNASGGWNACAQYTRAYNVA